MEVIISESLPRHTYPPPSTCIKTRQEEETFVWQGLKQKVQLTLEMNTSLNAAAGWELRGPRMSRSFVSSE